MYIQVFCLAIFPPSIGELESKPSYGVIGFPLSGCIFVNLFPVVHHIIGLGSLIFFTGNGIKGICTKFGKHDWFIVLVHNPLESIHKGYTTVHIGTKNIDIRTFFYNQFHKE